MHLNNGNCLKCLEIIRDCSKAVTEWFIQAQSLDHTLHASCGYRDEKTQNAGFVRGASNAIYGKSPHNYKPAPACDVWFLIDGKYNSDIARYKTLASNLPKHLESGINFKGLVDANHIQEKDWKNEVKGYPNGNS